MPQKYPIPARGLGPVRQLVIADVNGEVVSALLDESPVVPVTTTVTVAPHKLEGLAVTLGDRGVGQVSQADRELYPELDWIFDAGLQAECVAEFVPGIDGPEGWLVLPAPGLCLPANNPPAGQWVLLNHGPELLLDDPQDAMHLTEHGVSALDEHQLLITLREIEEGVIGAHLGNHLIGPLGVDDSIALLDTVRHYAALSITPVARGFHSPSKGSNSLVMYAAQASDTSAANGYVPFEPAPITSTTTAAAPTATTSEPEPGPEPELVEPADDFLTPEPDPGQLASTALSGRMLWASLAALIIVLGAAGIITASIMSGSSTKSSDVAPESEVVTASPFPTPEPGQ